MSVGGVLADYDSDRNFPVFGFGGRTPGGISHCFPLSNNPGSECYGVEGILEAYRESMFFLRKMEKYLRFFYFFLFFLLFYYSYCYCYYYYFYS